MLPVFLYVFSYAAWTGTNNVQIVDSNRMKQISGFNRRKSMIVLQLKMTMCNKVYDTRILWKKQAFIKKYVEKWIILL